MMIDKDTIKNKNTLKRHPVGSDLLVLIYHQQDVSLLFWGDWENAKQS